MRSVDVGKRGRYKLCKKKDKEGDDFIISDEEYGHSTNEDFEEAVSDDSSSDEDGDFIEGQEGSEDEHDEMLSDCPDDSYDEEVELSDEETKKKKIY